jgi:hypothetical protein
MMTIPSFFLIIARKKAENAFGNNYFNQHRITIGFKFLPHIIFVISLALFGYNAFLNFKSLIDGSCASAKH